MSQTQPLLSQIVADICAQVDVLEGPRQRGFLDWLQAHHQAGGPVSSDGLQPYLETRFKTLSPMGVVWEYRLLMDEISWWRHLNAERLIRISEEGR